MDAKNKFSLIKEQEIPELRTRAMLYEHIKTKARFLSLINNDENKVFGISFRTPPEDSTGVAHIMEHSVLNGSRKYPVKDPFKQLLGSSVKTFLNAFTYPDKTVYPCASANTKDFYNLVDVYLDTVFYPRLTKEAFMQEGWHYEIDDNGRLAYKGVVFNEMKGSYSNVDRIINKRVMESLFPDTVYSNDSGGSPDKIPDLTYEKFKEFHETYYHPSNSFIYFYGNDDVDKRFEIIDEYLGDFDFKEVKSQIREQERFKSPKKITKPYPASDGDKEIICVNWMIEKVDINLRYDLIIMSHILIGTSASPLRKAMIDSRIGDDFVSAIDPEDELLQFCFSAGLKGVDAKNESKVESVVLDELNKLVSDGIDKRAVDSAINTVEFGLREVDSMDDYPIPRGLNLYMQSLGMWLHGVDPIEGIAFEKYLTELKHKLKNNPSYFESLIEKHLLKNTHRTTVILEPDVKLLEKEAKKEIDKLNRLKESFAKSDIDKIKEELKKFKKWQEEEDSPEDMASIPALSLNDLDTKIKSIPMEKTSESDVSLLYHNLDTNGIVYVDFGFDLTGVPVDLLPYVSLLEMAFLEMGTKKHDYVDFIRRIGTETGGISVSNLITQNASDGSAVAFMFMRGRSLESKVGDMMSIMMDALMFANIGDKDRLKQILTEAKVGFEAGMTQNGHMIVGSRIQSMLSLPGWVSERMSGIEQLRFIRKILEKIDTDWDDVYDKINKTRDLIIDRGSMVVNVTCDHGIWKTVKSDICSAITEFPSQMRHGDSWEISLNPKNEGLSVQTKVNYVGKGTNLYELGYKFDGSSMVISKFLRNGYLWDTVRVRGGAYGGFCSFDKNTGVFVFASYRDPNISETISYYDLAGKYLRECDIDKDGLEKIKIATIGDLDSYLLPQEKGFVSLVRNLTGETEESRQKTRDEVFSTDMEDFHDFADVLEKANKHGIVSILGSEKSLKESGIGLDVTKIL